MTVLTRGRRQRAASDADGGRNGAAERPAEFHVTLDAGLPVPGDRTRIGDDSTPAAGVVRHAHDSGEYTNANLTGGLIRRGHRAAEETAIQATLPMDPQPVCGPREEPCLSLGTLRFDGRGRR
jgi:hypothetical protein